MSFPTPGQPEEDEVDLTNLIDLMVVLAAVLMLLLPAVPDRLARLEGLPTAGTDAAAEAGPQGSEATVVRFDEAGLWWNDEPVVPEELVRRAGRLPTGSPVWIAGTEDAPYGVSVRIRLALAEAGLATRELSRIPSPHSPGAPDHAR